MDKLVKVAELLNSLNLETPFGTIEHRVVVAGEVRWMQWMNRAIFDEQGNFVRFQSVGRDITQRKQMEEALRQSETREREKVTELALALDELKRTQTQLIQAEKMSSLGQMIAGVAHEINNPVSFIYANIEPASEYVQNLLNLLELYQQHYPNPVKKITEQLKLSDFEFIKQDFPKLLASMNDGAVRISQIVMSLKNFSHRHEAKRKQVNIHEGLDNTLLLIQHRLKQRPLHSEIIVIKEYGQLPKLECFPSELNQAFMNILCNAIDALDELAVSRQRSQSTKKSNHDERLTKDFRPIIRICTEVAKDSRVLVRIADNGVGIKPEVQPKIFDPFFTTKPPGKGTGLGLFICYQIVVEKHDGELTCDSVYGEGTEFVLKLPLIGRLS
ncbi:PAS domain S-box protein [Scytonema sp. UIC 10036]|uniref:sensor histidine kinase n=1 Tax=Scytonema sp. UIC 10036 TaxID=2304196 RepID=UPI0012DA7685|nr:ATP-binding protein [Scytonema sp. UIC 10036]MUG95015.1 PAS domain S-box protein [Scytonema sp. UIC 10036]